MKSCAVSEIEIAAVFAYVGLQPNTSFVQDLFNLDSTGRIAADTLTRTKMPGVFAAGTIRAQSPCRAASAAGDGATAAVAADRYLADRSWSAQEINQDSEALRAVARG
jgi:thioredoxin reductase (NADPH)